MAKDLLLMIILICCLQTSRGTVCREAEIYNEFRRNALENAQEVGRWDPPSTYRSLLQALENCTVFYGRIVIHDSAARESKFGENVRPQDFRHLRKIEKIFGTLYLDLNKFPEIKKLSFLSKLREIHGPEFALINSQVEMFDFQNLTLDVTKVNVTHNSRLCYLERFRTLSSSIDITMKDNKDDKVCAREGKVCSTMCSPKKGCWGPDHRHCFQCLLWRAGVECVNKCQSKPGFFKPPKGRICARCHVDCGRDCPRVCQVCKMDNLMEFLWRNKPKYKEYVDSRSGEGDDPSTPRSLLQALENCTEYHGDLVIKSNSIRNRGFEEYLRSDDFYNLRNLREIHGYVHLNLLHHPEIKSLSFFSNLRLIQTSIPGNRGLILKRSQVEMIDLRNIRFNVPFIGIAFNHQLCYLDNFKTINSSSSVLVISNKDPKICRQEGKVCNRLCNPSKGCWGPDEEHCFECLQWRAGSICVDKCEAIRGFYTPSNGTGHVCGRCHLDCKRECPPVCQVCDEQAMMNVLWIEKPRYKIEIDSRGGISWTPRSIVKNLEYCTEYFGNIRVTEFSAFETRFEEHVRYYDLNNMKNLRTVHGYVHLDLFKFPEFKYLSFFASLRVIESSEKGFNLTRSQVEMIGFSNVRLDVPSISIEYNDQLCFLERFETINSSSTFTVKNNKDPKICAQDGKVCSTSCNPSKGCWGPSSRQCFVCRWRAGDDCVDRCEAMRGFFTSPDDRICGRCHPSCTNGCFGPRSNQCHYYRPQPIDYCRKYMFFDAVTSQCKECSPSCFGNSYNNRSQVINRACSGSGNFSGSGGCSHRCQEKTVRTVSSDGLLDCLPCHPQCASGCQNVTMLGCLKKKPGEMSQGTMIGIVVGILILVAALVIYVIWTNGWICRHRPSTSKDYRSIEESCPFRRRGKRAVDSGYEALQLRDMDESGVVFLSYESSSESLVQKIRKGLEKDFRCRMNGPGEEAEYDQIRNCRVMLTCVNDEYLKSDNCQKEVEMARKSKRSSKSPFPVIVAVSLSERIDLSSENVNKILRKHLNNKICVLNKNDIQRWEGNMVDKLMKKLRRIIPRVKVLVQYNSEEFDSAGDVNPSDNEFDRQIKCSISNLIAGETMFEQLRNSLKEHFSPGTIYRIDQSRGKIDGTEVARVTCRDPEMMDRGDHTYCDVNGKEYPDFGRSEYQRERRESQVSVEEYRIHERSRNRVLLICGRTTVLKISERPITVEDVQRC